MKFELKQTGTCLALTNVLLLGGCGLFGGGDKILDLATELGDVFGVAPGASTARPRQR